MKFFDDEMLKKLSVDDMDLLREELRVMDRQTRTELESRKRNCSYCGERTGASLKGSKYCTAWHKYLDAHRHSALLSRVEFERKRALRRIRVLRHKGIRQVLSEYRAITGEGLGQSLRAQRESRNAGA